MSSAATSPHPLVSSWATNSPVSSQTSVPTSRPSRKAIKSCVHSPCRGTYIHALSFSGSPLHSSINSYSPQLALGRSRLILTTITTNSGECFYCLNSYSSRCSKSLLFGSAVLDGAQAEYVRVPLADSTVYAAPPGIEDKTLILMADIFPTGYF